MIVIDQEQAEITLEVLQNNKVPQLKKTCQVNQSYTLIHGGTKGTVF